MPLSRILRAHRETAILLLLLLANTALRLVVALRPLEALDQHTLTDDTYLALTIARNIARGLGPLYGNAPTNGFQPLYVFLIAPAFVLFPNDPFAPLRSSLIVLVLFDTLALYVLHRFVRQFSTSTSTPIVASTAWIANPYIFTMTLNGLETAIAAFFVLASLWYFHFIIHEHTATGQLRRYICLGLLLGSAILARIDTGLMAVALAVMFVWQHRRQWDTRTIVALLCMVAGTLAVVLPWVVYAYGTTQLLFPISGKAVRFNSLADVHHHPTIENLYLPMLRRAVGTIFKNNWVQMSLIAVFCLIVVWRRPPFAAMRQRFHVVMPALLFAALLTAAYVCYIFAPWFFDRYLFPVGVVVLLLMALCADLFFTCLPPSQHVVRIATVGLVCLIFVLNVQQQSVRTLFVSNEAPRRGYMNLGLWAREAFPAGTRLGAMQSGALGYFADHFMVVNLDGVVNASAYKALVERRMMEYIKAQRIAYIIGWRVDKEYIVRHSSRFAEHDLVLVKPIAGFTSWGEQWYLWRVRYDE